MNCEAIGSISLIKGLDENEDPVLHVCPGYHVNTDGPVQGWEQYRVSPTLPYRIYAGPAETVFYRFPDRATFEVYAISAGILSDE